MAYNLKNRNRESDLVVSDSVASQTAPLKAGEYTVYCKQGNDCFLRTGATANTVTAANSQRLIAGNMIEVVVDENDRIGAISETGSSTLEICKVL